jgi:hypothetical protein
MRFVLPLPLTAEQKHISTPEQLLAELGTEHMKIKRLVLPISFIHPKGIIHLVSRERMNQTNHGCHSFLFLRCFRRPLLVQIRRKLNKKEVSWRYKQ